MVETIKIREDNGKICTVGQISNLTFYKRVHEKDHLHKKMDAWGMDAEVFKILEVECNCIKVLDEKNDVLYKTTPTAWRMLGKYMHFKPHRAQIFLKRKHFDVTHNYMKNKNKQ